VENGDDKGGVWTPLRILQWSVPFLKAKGFRNPRLDSEVLLAHALGVDRLKVYLQFDRPLDHGELDLIRGLFKRRAAQEPLQYIIGTREFYGFSFQVGPGVLIPRPETEGLVEKALSLLEPLPVENRKVLDLGTGSGCIAIALAKKVPCRVWAVDKSEKALEIAKKNGEILGVSGSIQWRLGYWFGALLDGDPPQFQLLVSNPPYIAEKEREALEAEVREFEPSGALFGGADGMQAFQEIAKKAFEKVVPGGSLLLELHPDRWEGVSALFPQESWPERELVHDLAGHARVLVLKKSTTH